MGIFFFALTSILPFLGDSCFWIASEIGIIANGYKMSTCINSVIKVSHWLAEYIIKFPVFPLSFLHLHFSLFSLSKTCFIRNIWEWEFPYYLISITPILLLLKWFSWSVSINRSWVGLNKLLSTESVFCLFICSFIVVSELILKEG